MVAGAERCVNERRPNAVQSDDPNSMKPEQLHSWLDRRGWSARKLARTLGRHHNTIWQWLNDKAAIPPELPLALCELERRHAEVEGLGTMSCPACGALAVEDDGLDDRYGCILCGERADPDAPTKGRRP